MICRLSWRGAIERGSLVIPLSLLCFRANGEVLLGRAAAVPSAWGIRRVLVLRALDSDRGDLCTANLLELYLVLGEVNTITVWAAARAVYWEEEEQRIGAKDLRQVRLLADIIDTPVWRVLPLQILDRGLVLRREHPMELAERRHQEANDTV